MFRGAGYGRDGGEMKWRRRIGGTEERKSFG